jgi:hypothetical protein
MTATITARLAELKSMPMPDLKARWRELMATEPPPYNRKFLESRLAYRVQELAFGGLKPETLKRLAALAEGLDNPKRSRGADRPVIGTRLIREWQGVEHCVAVTAAGYEYVGRPYKSLSAAARAITGTRWNGWLFFGLKAQRGRG